MGGFAPGCQASSFRANTLVEAIDNVESAAAAGDSFPTTRVLAADGVISMIGCLMGNPFILAVYIGHPGWKAMGGRIGYAVATVGAILFLVPTSILMVILSWPFFLQSYDVGEWSSDSGGLVRWPIKLVIPVGFLLLALQGVSEIVKRAAFLLGRIPDPLEQHHEPIVEEFLKGAVE